MRSGVAGIVLGAFLLPGAATAGDAKMEGYAEWRKNDVLIVDGQRVKQAQGARFKGNGAAHSFAAIPLGYEVKVKGTRLPDGVVVAREIEAKPNGDALFEGDIKAATAELESAWVKEGEVYQGSGAAREDIGKLRTSGPQVDRVRRVVDRLVPPYRRSTDFRVYVVDHKEWNAFACANGMIVVHSQLLNDMDDDELGIILGHELVHATHEHSRKQFKRAMWVQLLAVGAVAGVEGGVDKDKKKTKAVLEMATLFSAVAITSGYGRDQEDQADRVGLRYAYEAGFDVRKAPLLWRKFAKKYGNENRIENFFFGDHSQSLARASNLDREIALNYAE